MSRHRFYTAEEVANILVEDLPLPGNSSDLDSSSDSENEEIVMEDPILKNQSAMDDDVAEIIEEDSLSEYLTSASESDNDVSGSGPDERENGSNDDPENTGDQVQDDDYDVDQCREWKKVEKRTFEPEFGQPQGETWYLFINFLTFYSLDTFLFLFTPTVNFRQESFFCWNKEIF